MPRILAAAFVLALALAGCESATDTPAYSAAGTWTGQSGGMLVELRLTQSGSDVNGTGALAGVAAGVTGTLSSGSLALTLRSQGFSEVHLTGTFASSTRIDATLNDSGFDHYPVTLRKQ